MPCNSIFPDLHDDDRVLFPGDAGWQRVGDLRAATAAPTNALGDYTPPDPYAPGLAVMRVAMKPKAMWPEVTPTSLPLDANGVPDPYAAGIKALREKEK
jgi:hypothetical protein